jgi:hypothetical protein
MEKEGGGQMMFKKSSGSWKRGVVMPPHHCHKKTCIALFS